MFGPWEKAETVDKFTHDAWSLYHLHIVITLSTEMSIRMFPAQRKANTKTQVLPNRVLSMHAWLPTNQSVFFFLCVCVCFSISCGFNNPTILCWYKLAWLPTSNKPKVCIDSACSHAMFLLLMISVVSTTWFCVNHELRCHVERIRRRWLCLATLVHHRVEERWTSRSGERRLKWGVEECFEKETLARVNYRKCREWWWTLAPDSGTCFVVVVVVSVNKTSDGCVLPGL